MKKQVLMVAALCLLAITVKANDLAEQLCSDAVFVEMITKTDQVRTTLLSMTDAERKQYVLTEEFACFRETLAAGKVHLAKTYNITETNNREVVLKALKARQLPDRKRCYEVYAMMWTSCQSIPDMYHMAMCFIAAEEWYANCTGGGVE